MNQIETKWEKNHNQVFAQIILPFSFALAALITGGYFLFMSAAGESANLRQWSDIAAVLIFLPFILIIPILLVLLLAGIALIGLMQEKSQQVIGNIRPVILRLNSAAANAARMITSPLIAIKSLFAVLKMKGHSHNPHGRK